MKIIKEKHSLQLTHAGHIKHLDVLYDILMVVICIARYETHVAERHRQLHLP